MKQQNLLNAVFLSLVLLDRILLSHTESRTSRTMVSYAKRVSIIAFSISLLSLSSVALSGCTPSAEAPDSDASSSQPQPTDPITETPQPEISLPSETSEGAPEIDSGAVSSAQLPEAVRASVLEDIAASNNVPIDALEVEAAVPQSWPDGCLGLGGPDEICTFALVDGWEVTVSQGDDVWVYRTDSDGFVVREDV